jgi:hypothetical protein
LGGRYTDKIESTLAMNAPAADLQGVTRAMLHEIRGVMGLARVPGAAHLVQALFGPSARRLARMLVRLDAEVTRCGLAAAAGNLLSKLIHDCRIDRPQPIPRQGPLLVVSNHPGAYDLLMLAASLARDDLKIISSDIVIFHHLPSVAPHFISITEDPHRRMVAFRAGLRHLLDGKALLLFPRGEVEIDPALSARALQGMAHWSPSLELYLRSAPGTFLVIATVSGVLSPHWFNRPVLRIWKKTEQRQKVAEIIQVAEQLIFSKKARLTPRVSFSPALHFSQEGELSAPRGQLMQTVTHAAQAQVAALINEAVAE